MQTKKCSWNSRKRKLFQPDKTYRGRFAPSPTGPLHFGSLVAAVGSYLDAKYHNGIWLLRMEDLDAPRCMPGAADDILRTLETFGLYWDETVLYQSQRTAAYEDALHQLQRSGMVYPCACTRKEIADSALHGIEGFVYPGTCRDGMRSLTPGPSPGGRGESRQSAWRVRTNPPLPNPDKTTDETTSHSTKHDKAVQVAGYPPRGEGIKPPSPSGGRAGKGGSSIEFDDALQSHIFQHLETEIGDFVVKRADGLFAYQLAVVVDDAFQNITHVVRGTDLLASTPRQIYLQRLLGLSTPHYMHLPIAVNAQGEKLSKQTLASPVELDNPAATLLRALKFLRQEAPDELASYKSEEILDWASERWNRDRLIGVRQKPAD